MVTDLGHAAFACADLERALAFYAKLGIREAFRLNREDGTLMLVYLHVAGDRFIEVFPASGPLTSGQPISYMHLCLVVDDVKAMAEQLRAEGIAIERGPSLGLDHNWQAWVRDPDGNAIELMQLVEHSPQRRVARGEAAWG